MTDDSTAALDALKSASARYRRTETAHAGARDATVAAVVAALRAGVPPTLVERNSPFTAAHIRTIAREHGIPPAKPGIKKRTGD